MTGRTLTRTFAAAQFADQLRHRERGSEPVLEASQERGHRRFGDDATRLGELDDHGATIRP